MSGQIALPSASFEAWLGSFSWLRERDLPCIVSADLDGMSCGLFQQEALNWEVVGTYDTSSLCLWKQPKSIDWARTVFLDVEILRTGARSLGNHLLAIDSAHMAVVRESYPACANPNIWRGINAWDSFQQKFPFSSLPLLVCARMLHEPGYKVPHEWLALVLQTDSSFTNAAQYQANALSWLELMGMGTDTSPLRRFCEVLRRMPAQTALKMVDRVQGWAIDAGFGRLQRACRFNPADSVSLKKASLLSNRLMKETGSMSRLPFDHEPCHVETLETAQLEANGLGRLRASITQAQKDRVVSMAVTSIADTGLSYTKASMESVCPFFRPT